MKKSLLFCGVAALAFASCTQNEVLDVNENRAIGFDNFVGKPTRTGETTSETIESGFGVYGGNNETNNLFSDVKVYKDGGAWTYDNTKYWVPNKTYRFAAYAPQAEGVITPTWSYNDNKLTFNITCDAANQNDLVYGVAAELTTEGDLSNVSSPVSFTMGHILSKLNFVVKAGDIESDAALKVENVTVAANINTTGTYDDAWTPTGSASSVTFTGTNVPSIAAAGQGNIGTFYVIPQTLSSSVTVKFTVTLTSGGAQIGNPTELTATISNPTWAKDYVYTYVATVNQENITGGKPIEFTGSVSGWTNTSGGGDMSIQE